MIVTFDSKKPSKSESKTTIKSTNHEKSFLIENNDYKSFKSSKRSKNGCVTCKIRKKKCDELKPICLECKRLKKECIWVDYDNMNDEQIHEIKQLVEKAESNNKLRKRKRSLQHHNNLNNNMTTTNTNNNNNNNNNTTTSNSTTNNTNNPHHNLTYVNSNIESNTPPDIQNLIDAAKDDFEMFNPLSPNNSSYSTELVPINYSSPSGANSPNQLLHSMSSPNVNDTTNNQLSLTTSGTFSPNDFFNYLKDINQEFLHDYNIISPQSPNLNQILNNFSNPSPKLNPSILATKLNDRSLELYNYYVNVLTPYISVAPRSHSNNVNENHYQTVFLPLAHQDDGVMNSILAWSSFHMNNHKSNKEGLQYLETALKHFHSKTSNERSTIINKLATMLVLLGAEICRGDVKNWLNYMEWGSKLLQSNGGLANFNSNKQEFWLISNFAYHDVLSSNTTERGTYFKMDQYKEIFSHDLTSGILNPLVGIAKDIYVIIGEISHLSFETNKNLKNLMDELNEKNVSDSPIYEVKQSIDESSGVSDDLAHDTTKHKLDDTQEKSGEEEIEVDVKPNLGVDIDGDVDNYSELSSHAKINNLLSSVIEKTKDLDRKIEEAKPNKEDLYGLNDQEFEWQITLFETFKLSSKLYLRQSIGKNNPSSLESQVLNNDLIKCLDIVLGSPVESVLVFPVFISAIHCITKLGRSNMLNRIDNYMKTYGPWSIIRAKEVIEKIWDINPDGDKVIDWHAILKDLGWEINFA